MRYLVTSEEMKEYDYNTIEHIGIPALVLMERAALAVRDEIIKMTGREKDMLETGTNRKVLIAVGSGNNGADGLALARLMAEVGFRVQVCECGRSESETESYRVQKNILSAYNEVVFVKDISSDSDSFDFVVDGIFGIGLSRPVNEGYAENIQRLNQLAGCKVAIDIPSGINATDGRVMGCAFRADVTITFGFGKRGLYLFPGAEYAGRVVTAQIGIDSHGFFGRIPEMFTYDETPEQLLPPRRRDGNKGTFGKILLIAGWEQMAGAAIMSARALLETGAGMVKVFCGEDNRPILQCAVPEAMYGSMESLEKDMNWADVIVAGPGLGQSQKAEKVLEQIVCASMEKAKTGSQISLVLDADALNGIAKSDKLQKLLRSVAAENNGLSVIMTPHMGELARLCGKDIAYIKDNLPEVAKTIALDYGSVMVCKDARTLVYAKGEPLYLNITGNSGMATAGSGDVLAGIIGSLLAQGMGAFAAASVGVYLHSLAGDKAAEQYTEYGVTATKIIQQLK